MSKYYQHQLNTFFLFRGCGPENVRVETKYIYDTTERTIIKDTIGDGDDVNIN